MDILFVSSVSIIVQDPADGRRLFVEALGLPLSAPEEGDEYVFSEALPGSKHFGVWPLAQAAQACFGTDQWPTTHAVPQASVEFDVDDVAAAAAELEGRGHTLLHAARTEPWGQDIARLQTADGVIVGVSRTPWLRDDAEAGR